VKVLVIGCGLVGTPLARRLRADGHHVTGTTTTPDKVEALRADACDEVLVLRGTDAEAVAAAVGAADAVIVTAGPSAQRSMTPEDRAVHYREVLADTARSVASALGDRPVIAYSSLVVYGNDADHLDVITEDTPVTDWPDPSPVNFIAAEQAYLATPNACVFRCPEIHGEDDMPLEDKVRMAHQLLGGSVPFRADARFYQVHADRVVAATLHALAHDLTGVFNLVPEEAPPTNAEVFDGISAELGLPPLTYRGELPGPAAPVSSARLAATGFTV
jgi:nucleoside-diphosphate-sugar epimerase